MGILYAGGMHLFLHRSKDITITRRKEVLLLLTTLVCDVSLLLSYPTGQYFAYGSLVAMLLLCSYIDYYGKYVYRYMSILLITFGSIYFLIMRPTAINWIGLILYVILFQTFRVLKVFGLGDVLLYHGITLFFLPLEGGAYVLLFHLLFANIFFLLYHIKNKNIRIKKMKLKEQKPFVPFMTLATILCLIIM